MNVHNLGEAVKLLDSSFKITAVNGSNDSRIAGFTSLDDAMPDSICFADKKYADSLSNIKCGLALVNFVPDKQFNSPYIVLENPRKAFMHLMRNWIPQNREWGIHDTAVIHPNAEIDPEVHIGPFCIIGECTIGKGAILRGNVCVDDNVIIGDNVIVDYGSVLGTDGLGFERNAESNEIEYFPHIGKLIIGDNTRIYTNVTIARGTLSNTIIGKGCAIDCFTKIGHNVIVEDNVSIASHCVIGGSSAIGANTNIFLNAIIYDKISIGKNCHIGPATIVMANLADNTKTTARPNNINL